MGELHRLESCHRCRRVFVARGAERFCPDCLRARRREANRRALGGGATGWAATGVFAVGTVGAALVAQALHVASPGLGAWVGGALAVAYVARQP